jgi:predicted 3-demethylubiquinone-9 3-methyltransferase (glyoxalase superfamily)
MTKVTQHLWFEKDMEAAVHFYTSLIPARPGMDLRCSCR